MELQPVKVFWFPFEDVDTCMGLLNGPLSTLITRYLTATLL